MANQSTHSEDEEVDTLSSDYLVRDGVLSLVVLLPKCDIVVDGTWVMGGMDTVPYYGRYSYLVKRSINCNECEHAFSGLQKTV